MSLTQCRARLGRAAAYHTVLAHGSGPERPGEGRPKRGPLLRGHGNQGLKHFFLHARDDLRGLGGPLGWVLFSQEAWRPRRLRAAISAR